MPLIEGKSKSAFSHNVGSEMRAGKPQNQSVAIAYSEKAKAEHKKHLAMGGKVAGCGYCMGGYADGGMADEMSQDPDHEAMLDQCVEECMDALETRDKASFRSALEVLIRDICEQMEDDEDEDEE